MAATRDNAVGSIPLGVGGESFAWIPLRFSRTHEARTWPLASSADVRCLSLPALLWYRQRAGVVRMRLGDEHHRYPRIRTGDPSVWPV